MNIRRASIAVALLPLALALHPRADKLSFQPAANSSVAREYEIAANIDQVDVSVSLNGADMSENLPGDLSISFKLGASVANNFIESRDGKPIDLIRSFSKLVVEYDAFEKTGSESVEELEGKQVRYKWNGETNEYDKSFHESEGDEKFLKALTADMDLTQILPTKEVSVGDTWTITGEGLNAIMSFGLDTTQMDNSEGEEAEMMAMIEELLQPQIDKMTQSLTATCTYKGKRQVDERDCAEIELTYDGGGTLDMAAVIRQVAEKQIPPEVEVKLDIGTATVAVKLKGTGTLLWDHGAGLMHAFDMNCDLGTKIDFQMSADAMGQTQDVDAQVDASGVITWKASKAQ